jgi:hypothetical protein
MARVGRLVAAVVLLAAAALPRAAAGCVGDACINIYSTEPGGGKITTNFDFARRKVQTFLRIPGCTTCIYNNSDPGLIKGSEPPPAGYYPIADGVAVRFETVAQDDGVTFRLNNEAVDPGESSLVGTTPTLHNHPTWQLKLPAGQQGDFQLQFKLTTDSPLYSNSDTFTAVLTNAEPPPTATPTPTPTFAIPPCVGDCDDDGTVSLGELVEGVGGALGRATCAAFDVDGDGDTSVQELVMAVNASMNTCVPVATPTPTLPATLAAIQASIFSPRCAIPTCHDSESHTGNLDLSTDQSHDELVGVLPFMDQARDDGFLRVDPGNPANSFLLIKLEGPPLGQGGRMPLTGTPLTPAEIDVLRAWIEDGALP